MSTSTGRIRYLEAALTFVQKCDESRREKTLGECAKKTYKLDPKRANAIFQKMLECKLFPHRTTVQCQFIRARWLAKDKESIWDLPNEYATFSILTELAKKYGKGDSAFLQACLNKSLKIQRSHRETKTPYSIIDFGEAVCNAKGRPTQFLAPKHPYHSGVVFYADLLETPKKQIQDEYQSRVEKIDRQLAKCKDPEERRWLYAKRIYLLSAKGASEKELDELVQQAILLATYKRKDYPARRAYVTAMDGYKRLNPEKAIQCALNLHPLVHQTGALHAILTEDVPKKLQLACKYIGQLESSIDRITTWLDVFKRLKKDHPKTALATVNDILEGKQKFPEDARLVAIDLAKSGELPARIQIAEGKFDLALKTILNMNNRIRKDRMLRYFVEKVATTNLSQAESAAKGITGLRSKAQAYLQLYRAAKKR